MTPSETSTTLSGLQVLSNEDTRAGVLSYLTLTEIQVSIRGACRSSRKEADGYKMHLVERLNSPKNPKVLIIDL